MVIFLPITMWLEEKQKDCCFAGRREKPGRSDCLVRFGIGFGVVKIEAEGLPTIPLGDATKLKVGEPAIAIGNPLGLQFQRTVTSGIISALNRTIEVDTEQGTNYMEGLIQTDASINPETAADRF